MTYIRARYIREQGAVLLEIKLPQEILKSPAAMELVFVQLWQSKPSNYVTGYFLGEVRPWFSLELVSIGGTVRFFIWAPAKLKKLVQNSIYAQYPEVEIYEAEDYSHDVVYDPERSIYWFTYFKFTKPDAYPIKTYIDYGLDKNPDEEYRIDPMSPLIEYLGGLQKGEQTWIQILIQAHRKLEWKDVALPKADWKDAAKKEVQKIIKEAQPEGTERPTMMFLTEEKKDLVTAIERSIGKYAFETVVRGYYMAEKEAFNGSNIGGLIGCLKQFNSENRNGFRLGKRTSFDYPWEDFRDFRRRRIEKKMLDAYKRRSYFNPPHRLYRQAPYILTVEELATVFHFPGSAVATPTLERVSSKKAEAPVNLPI